LGGVEVDLAAARSTFGGVIPTPACDRVPFRFTGKLHKVTIRVQPRTLSPAEEDLLRREAQRSNRASE
jgi:hypothetical protein